jgi:hypothetical protein
MSIPFRIFSKKILICQIVPMAMILGAQPFFCRQFRKKQPAFPESCLQVAKKSKKLALRQIL